MRKRSFFTLLAVLLTARAPAFGAVLAQGGQAKAVIVVPAASDAAGSGKKSGRRGTGTPADELQSYLRKATGATFTIVPENRIPADAATVKIYIGACAATRSVVDLDGLQPEGFVLKVRGDDVFIVGQDRTKEGLEVSGTAYGCYAFLEKFLGVRWLMPGELGEVVPAVDRLVVADTEIREEPLLWQRRIRDSEIAAHRDRVPKILQDWGVDQAAWEKNFATEITGPWFTHQRLGSRVKLSYGHAFGGWWERFHEKYPDIFAQQPDGTRNAGPVREKMCVSNPQLWELVAQEKLRELKADPFLTAASISPNDGGGAEHCSCARCRAWDPKNAAKVGDDDPDAKAQGVSYSLTDRYFRFYNEVARRVAKEMPDRYLGAYAYSIYRVPPVELKHLEKNLMVGFVGFGSYANDAVRAKDRDYWLQWGRLANQLFIRPNLFWSGLGLPRNYVRKLAEDIRFMAENDMRAADYDGLVGNWGTDGLNYYAAAKLLWNPRADPAAIVDDYCNAAYGKGAGAMKAYYARLEALLNTIAAEGKYGTSDNQNRTRLEAANYVGHYSDVLLAELRAHTDKALSAIGNSDSKAAARVKLVVEGIDYAAHVRRLVLAAAAVREGRSTAADYNKVFEEENRFFASKALSWSVAMPHDYSYIRATLILK